MKKIISLIKATFTSDMNVFKIKQKGKKTITTYLLLAFITYAIMSSIYSYANFFLDSFASVHLEHLVLAIFVIMISLFTIVEGIYKCGPLIFNCKDDQLLLSLPIKKSTVLFIRLLKFYVFELIFNSLFMLPVILAYIVYTNNTSIIFYLVSLVMLIILPIVPIIISLILGFISSSISSRFKYKNIVETIVAFIFLLGMMYVSFNIKNVLNYLVENATTLNELITKFYYPAGMYSKLAVDFNLLEFIIFILINVGLLVIAIYVLSLFYFKINSNLKEVTKSSKGSKDYKIKYSSVTKSLIKKELNTFVSIPVLIINAGFGLVLFIAMAIILVIKYDSLLDMVSSFELMNIDKSLIINNTSLIIFALICFTSFTTYITNSLVSLEGKGINILKSLPVNVKTILMSKVYTCELITAPIILVGNILLFIKFKTSILDIILLSLLAILVPLISHIGGLIINLYYPKLDFETSAEVVKQSFSTFICSMLGMVMLFSTIGIIISLVGKVSASMILLVTLLITLIIDIILYLILSKVGVKKFKSLSI